MGEVVRDILRHGEQDVLGGGVCGGCAAVVVDIWVLFWVCRDVGVVVVVLWWWGYVVVVEVEGLKGRD